MLDRFSQIKPKVIFSVEAVCYNGKTHDHLKKLQSVVEGVYIRNYCIALHCKRVMCFVYMYFVSGLPDLEKVIVFPFCCSEESIDTSTIPKWYVRTVSVYKGRNE